MATVAQEPFGSCSVVVTAFGDVPKKRTQRVQRRQLQTVLLIVGKIDPLCSRNVKAHLASHCRDLGQKTRLTGSTLALEEDELSRPRATREQSFFELDDPLVAPHEPGSIHVTASTRDRLRPILCPEMTELRRHFGCVSRAVGRSLR
jgi:hypothetical protein